MHIALIGDSVFDNKVYVGDQPSTIEQLQKLLPGHTCELLAVDGSVTDQVIERQLPRLSGQDVIFVSTGGNDALRYSDLIYTGFDSSAIPKLKEAQDTFQAVYEKLITKLKDLGIPFVVFTIYSGNFGRTDDLGIPVPETAQDAAEVLISIFNDIIYRVCAKYGVKVIENRDLFTSSEDYANPIEPSTLGSLKMAKAMVSILKNAAKRKGRHS
jgi:lysophospholipase L1-like esterase